MNNLTDGERFLAQNLIAAATLNADEVEGWAEHHAGGLYVLMFNNLPDGRVMKLHDSWGDDVSVVVHTYDPDQADDDAETVLHFDTGREAFEHFIGALSPPCQNVSMAGESGYTAGPISIDEGPTVLAQYHERERWNGWLCPRIDAISAVAVLDWLNEVGPEYGYDYDFDAAGSLILTDRQYRDEDPDYVPEELPADADGLYSLGAYSWVWSEGVGGESV